MTIADRLSELAEALKNPAMAALCREHADLVEVLIERDARIAELEAKLAKVRVWREEWGPVGYYELEAILDGKEDP